MRGVRVSNLSRWPSVDMSASIIGPWIKVDYARMLSMQITWSTGGSLAGTITVETSNGDETYPGSNEPDSTAATLDGATWTVSGSLIGGDATLQVQIPYATFGWARFKWVRTSGAAQLLDSKIVLKGE